MAKQVTVLNEKYTVKGMTYREYLSLAKQVVSKNVSPIPEDDFSTLQLFMLIMRLTARAVPVKIYIPPTNGLNPREAEPTSEVIVDRLRRAGVI